VARVQQRLRHRVRRRHGPHQGTIAVRDIGHELLQDSG
jgi:hypothetical protein